MNLSLPNQGLNLRIIFGSADLTIIHAKLQLLTCICGGGIYSVDEFDF